MRPYQVKALQVRVGFELIAMKSNLPSTDLGNWSLTF